MAFWIRCEKELIIRKKIIFAPFWIKMKTRWRMWWENKRIEREREWKLFWELKEKSSKNQARSYAMISLRKIYKKWESRRNFINLSKIFPYSFFDYQMYTGTFFLCCNNIHAQFKIRILTTCGTLLRSIVIVWV